MKTIIISLLLICLFGCQEEPRADYYYTILDSSNSLEGVFKTTPIEKNQVVLIENQFEAHKGDTLIFYLRGDNWLIVRSETYIELEKISRNDTTLSFIEPDIRVKEHPSSNNFLTEIIIVPL